jgi:membrane protein YqaA with SNARE-associated domain
MATDESRPPSVTGASLPIAKTQGLSDRALLWRFAAGLLALVVSSASANHFFGEQFDAFAHTFLSRVGVVGCALGTWLADAFSFPIPPQVYMAMVKDWPSLLRIFPLIVLGSLLGGVTGYLLSPSFVRFKIIAEGVRRSEAKVRALSGRGWVRGVVVVSLSPVAFSLMCYAAGLYRVPKPAFALLCLLRIPKLMLYQALIWYTWK